MARIPFAQVAGDVVSVAPPPAIDLGTASQAGGGPVLAGIGRGLSAAAEIGEKLVQARDSVNVSNALVDASVELDRFRGDLDRDPDVAGREAKFAARAQEVKAAAAEKLGRAGAIDNFTIRYNQLSRTMQLQVMHAARDEELQSFRFDLADNLDKLATRAAFARSDAERQVLQAEAEKTIADAVRTGRINAVAAGTLRKSYLGRVDAALAGELVRAAPGTAIAALGDPEKFKYLDAPTRVQLRAQATQRAESLSAQANAELRADIASYTQARSAGQPVPPGVGEELIARAGGPNSRLGRQLVATRTFYDAVDQNTQTQSLPTLRANVERLENPKAEDRAKGSDQLLFDLGVARVVRRQQAEAERRATQDYHAIEREYEGVRRAGEPFQRIGDMLRMAADLDPSGGLVASIRERDSLYDRLAATKGEGAADVQQRISAIDALRDASGALSAERVMERGALIAARDRKLEELTRDPAAAALKYYPTIAESFQRADAAAQSGNDSAALDERNGAWAALLAAQRREGVPDHRLALLTHDGAEALRQKLLTTTDGQQRVDLVDQMRGQFGDHWPRVQAQLWQGKPAPGDVQVIGALPAGANVPKTEVAEANRITDQQATEVLGGKRLTTIDDAVRRAVEPMAAAMSQAPDGPSFLATYQGQIEKLARLYAIRGEADDRTAAGKAADRLFFDHWEIVDGVGGATVRVPKVQGEPAVPASAVRDMQRAVMAALPKLDLETPGGLPGTTAAQRRDMLVQTVRSSGYWMTTADDKGMVLMAGPGLPVRFADGLPLVVPFDSAAALDAIGQARRNLGRRITIGNADSYLIGPGEDPGSDPGPPAAWVPDGNLARFLRRAGEGMRLQGAPR